MLRMMEGFPPSHQLKKFNKNKTNWVKHVDVNCLYLLCMAFVGYVNFGLS